MTKSEAAEARKTTAPASSSGRPQRPGGHALPQPLVELRVLLQRTRQVGREVPRADRVRLDVVPRPVRAHPLRQHLQPALGGAVGGDPFARRLAHHRADVDDLAAAALDHPRRDRARDEERARQVDVEHALPLVERPLLERLAPRHAGVVDQHVDRPELRDTCGDRLLVGDVERRGDRAAESPRRPSPTASAERPLTATRAPASASACANASPRPRVEPVTSAVLPGQVEQAHAGRTGSTTCDG